jgi:hypothetical protein
MAMAREEKEQELDAKPLMMLCVAELISDTYHALVVKQIMASDQYVSRLRS